MKTETMNQAQYRAELAKKKKRSKYGSVSVVVDDLPFPSKKEAARYGILRMREKAEEISELELQVSFPVYINGVRVFIYLADFVYRDHLGMKVIEDVKGVRTPLYRLKKRLVEAYYKVKILET